MITEKMKKKKMKMVGIFSERRSEQLIGIIRNDEAN